MIGGGIDIGRTKDATVLVLCEQEDWEEPIYVRLVKVLSKMPFQMQRDTLRAYFTRYTPDLICIDSTGIGMDMAERLRMEMPANILPVTFTEEIKSTLMGVSYDFFTSGKVRVPRKYRGVQEEFSNIRKEMTPAGRVVYRQEPHGDISWATALAFYALKRGGGQGFAHTNTDDMETAFQKGQSLKRQMPMPRDFKWRREKACAYEGCNDAGKIESVVTGSYYCSLAHREMDKIRQL